MKRRYSKEEISKILNNINQEIKSGSTKDSAAKKEGITVQTLYRWQSKANPNDQAAEVMKLRRQIEKLKRLVGDEYVEKRLAEL